MLRPIKRALALLRSHDRLQNNLLLIAGPHLLEEIPQRGIVLRLQEENVDAQLAAQMQRALATADPELPFSGFYRIPNISNADLSEITFSFDSDQAR